MQLLEISLDLNRGSIVCESVGVGVTFIGKREVPTNMGACHVPSIGTRLLVKSKEGIKVLTSSTYQSS